MTVESIIKELDREISRLREARNLLSADGRGDSNKKSAKIDSKPRAKRRLSKEARERIAAAQRKRWAAQKKSKV